MRKIMLTGVVLLCAIFEIGAQSSPSFFTQKFNAYQAVLTRTKVHLVFNQDKFSPGDTAYFKAYFLKEDLSAVSGRQVMELNLVDSKGESKFHMMFLVVNGIGQNQMVIPSTLTAGIYLITAYSSWMKNFDPLPFFKKEILVASKGVIVPNNQPIARISSEGGHFIRGIDNRISIRTYRPGMSVKVVDAAGQEINKAVTDINGVCSFIIKPMSKSSYFVQVADDGIKTPLPAMEDDGCNLHVIAGQRAEPLKVIVTAPQGSALRNDELAIIVSSRRKIFYASSFRQGDKEFVELQIPLKDLPEGIANISLLKQNGGLLASRNFYHQEQGGARVKIHANKIYYQAREKASIEVSLTDVNGNPLEGEFSIKVLNAGLFDMEKENSLSDELNVLSGLPEKYHIDRSDSNWITNLDNYLISTKEDIPWKEILSNATNKPHFTFSNFIQKSGRAYFASTGKPIPDFCDIMFYLQRSKIRYQTTVENGMVWLAVPELFGQDELFYFGETFYYSGGIKHGVDIPDLKIDWKEDTIKLPKARISKETSSPDTYASFVNKSRLIGRSYGFYIANKGQDDGSIPKGMDIEEEISAADLTINVQDYIVFPTMAELVKEVIPSLQHRKAGGKNTVRVSLFESMSEVASGDPTYVIDGIATKNTDFFLSLKPADLLTVKIVNNPNKLTRFGLLGKNGIVIVRTRNGDARELFNDASKLIEGLNRPIDFRTPDHNNADRHQRNPDFRSTIYWNPAVKTDANGKATVTFFCSDDIGSLRIRIDGFASGREPFSAEEKTEVIVNPEKK